MRGARSDSREHRAEKCANLNGLLFIRSPFCYLRKARSERIDTANGDACFLDEIGFGVRIFFSPICPLWEGKNTKKSVLFAESPLQIFTFML